MVVFIAICPAIQTLFFVQKRYLEKAPIYVSEKYLDLVSRR